MAKATTRPRAKSASPSSATVDALVDEVAQLRADLDELRRQLAEEVRTRRLVVEDHEGDAVVTAEAAFDGGSLRVSSPTGEVRGDTEVLIYAWRDEHEDEDTRAGMMLFGQGDAYAWLDVNQGDNLPNGRSSFHASLSLDQPTAVPGMVLDSTGLQVHPMRLYNEQEAWKDKERAAGRLPE